MPVDPRDMVRHGRPDGFPEAPHPDKQVARPARDRARKLEHEAYARSLLESPIEPALPPNRRLIEVEIGQAVLLVVNAMRHARIERGAQGHGRGASRADAARRRRHRAGTPREPEGLLIAVLCFLVLRPPAERQVVPESGRAGPVEVDAIGRVEHAVDGARHLDGAFPQRIGSRIDIGGFDDVPGRGPEDPKRGGVYPRRGHAGRGEVGRADLVKPAAENAQPDPRAREIDAQRHHGRRGERRPARGRRRGAPPRRGTEREGRAQAAGRSERAAAPDPTRGRGGDRLDRPVPPHFEGDLVQRPRFPARRIPRHRANGHREEPLARGRHVPRRSCRPGASGRRATRVRQVRERGGDPRRADRRADIRIGEDVRKRDGLEDSERARRAFRGRDGCRDAPGNAQEHRPGGQGRTTGRGFVVGSQQIDLRQLESQHLAAGDRGLPERNADAVSGRRDGFDDGPGRVDGGERRGNGRRREPRSEERPEGGEARAADQRGSIRSASSTSITGMSSTIG